MWIMSMEWDEPLVFYRCARVTLERYVDYTIIMYNEI